MLVVSFITNSSDYFMIWHLLADQPEIALFASLSIGFFIGSFKLGPLQLGGVCGTLIVALVLGQSGARLSPDLKNIAFALFIFALGFTGGPQFFANIGRGWRYGVLSVIEIAVWASEVSKPRVVSSSVNSPPLGMPGVTSM